MPLVTPRPTPGTAPLVVFCTVARSVERIRSRFPSLEVIDITDGVPPGVQGEILFGGLGANSAEAMSRGVRWVQMAGTGIDGAPPEVGAVEVLTSARGASAVAISEYVIASMGAFARKFPETWLHEVPQRWNYQRGPVNLAGATLALLGFGGIAQRVARIALALEMSVVALRHRPLPSPVAGVELVQSVAELMAAADHLVLAAPATDLTHHVVNAGTLALVRPGLHLVNIARGALRGSGRLARRAGRRDCRSGVAGRH